MYNQAVRLLLVLLMTSTAFGAAAAKKSKVAASEAARRAFVKANAVMGDAKTPEDYAEAAKYYEEAAAAAPAWPDPRFNLAKARELRGDFAGAIKSLETYIALGGADKREAQDLIYVLETKRDRAGKAATAQASDARFTGRWYRTVHDPRGNPVYQLLVITRDGDRLRFAVAGSMHSGMFGAPSLWAVPESRIDGDSLAFVFHQEGMPGDVCARFRAKGVLSESGKLNIRYALVPFTEPQRDSCPYQDRFGDYQEEWAR
jgi:tetratricopeptide (TPR) repeat protein